ncbi:Phosphoribosylformylglycinamidine synthase [Operophtera brumata]|uniref:Phosphoribosylformylglycinamidine synthase n=1 Tax=Operophtera brumata TaxID=104452 RepID=A0A0L7LML3_OPEBR|nr:Phosphoribosylformylglycinamidine synthase [Operophtera brumata]
MLNQLILCSEIPRHAGNIDLRSVPRHHGQDRPCAQGREVRSGLPAQKKLLAGHDISEGGFITTLLEMGIAGVRGLNLNIELPGATPIEALFNEELGIVLEVATGNLDYVLAEYKTNGL